VPSGWKVVRHARLLTASRGDAKVEVRQFPLRRPYAPSDFESVGPEVARVANALAARLGAKATGRTVTVSGQKAWQYDIVNDKGFQQLTFVLRGKVEYQLYCRRSASESNSPCELLVSSFTLR
jgi:hypothetical protein